MAKNDTKVGEEMTLPPLPDPLPAVYRIMSHKVVDESLANRIKHEMQNYGEMVRIATLEEAARKVELLDGKIPRGGHGEARALSGYEYALAIRKLKDNYEK